MKMMTTTCCDAPVLSPAIASTLAPDPREATGIRSWARARFVDYLELTKPRIAVLVLFTVAIGALLAPGGLSYPVLIVNTLLGTALVAAGASAWNQVLERHTDALMRRTENRPLPSGRLQPVQAVLFGTCLTLAGILYLLVTQHRPWSALVAAVTFGSYVFIYTPLKRKTIHNTLVGALPGALPPVIGWAAIPGALSSSGGGYWKLVTVFLVMFFWQVPHFMAIAWIHRGDYARAGLRMVPGRDKSGSLTTSHMVLFCLALVMASLAPAFLGAVGLVYLVGALALGLSFLLSVLAFGRSCGKAEARRVLRMSLVYLPSLLALLLLDMLCGWK